MSNARSNIDPITLEILHNGLKSVTDETYITITKAAYSTNIKERRDHSTAIMDVAGRLIVQADNSLPIHLASMLGLMERLLEKFPLSEISEGDIFVANDPYVAGGTHLPDVNLAMPIFIDGRLLGFVCNLAHHADIGGMAPGSMAGGMSEIYQEGLRIPVVRLFRQGELVQDVLDLLLLNVRVPEERRGDYYAQIAACRLGERRMHEMAARYGADLLKAAYDTILERTETRIRTAVSAIPDGTYHFRDILDNDGTVNLISQRLRTQVKSDAGVAALVGFVIVAALLWLDYRRVRDVLLSLSPLLVGILWMLGGMSLAGIDMNFFNVFVTTMMIGIGVDYGVHMMHRYRESISGGVRLPV